MESDNPPVAENGVPELEPVTSIELAKYDKLSKALQYGAVEYSLYILNTPVVDISPPKTILDDGFVIEDESV